MPKDFRGKNDSAEIQVHPSGKFLYASNRGPDNIGVFALPAANADDTKLTVWLPNGVYIPKTTEGDQLAAAKSFVAFINSEAGCKVQDAAGTVAGPYAISTCKVPDDAPALVGRVRLYRSRPL